MSNWDLKHTSGSFDSFTPLSQAVWSVPTFQRNDTLWGTTGSLCLPTTLGLGTLLVMKTLKLTWLPSVSKKRSFIFKTFQSQMAMSSFTIFKERTHCSYHNVKSTVQKSVKYEKSELHCSEAGQIWVRIVAQECLAAVNSTHSFSRQLHSYLRFRNESPQIHSHRYSLSLQKLRYAFCKKYGHIRPYGREFINEEITQSLFFCHAGIDFVTRKAASMLKPQKIIEQDGDSFIVKTLTSFRNYTCEFKIGEEYEEVTKGLDNRKCQVQSYI